MNRVEWTHIAWRWGVSQKHTFTTLTIFWKMNLCWFRTTVFPKKKICFITWNVAIVKWMAITRLFCRGTLVFVCSSSQYAFLVSSAAASKVVASKGVHPTWRMAMTCARVDQLPIIGDKLIPPLVGNPDNGYINPYYWVDDHPLLLGWWHGSKPEKNGCFQKIGVPQNG